MDLLEVAQEIRDLLEKRREELSLSFIEEDHIYWMKDINNKLKSNFPSVSKIYKKFYKDFDSYTKSLEMCNGDKIKQKELLNEWKLKGDFSKNQGSRVHYFLEKELIKRYGDFKEVRQPVFDCTDEQIIVSDNMIIAGNNFLNLMQERGAVLLDTEVVLGDPILGYTGQPDKVWIIWNKEKTAIGLIVTDYKTNQPKNFEPAHYTDKMYSPFDKYDNIALSHYYLQIPLYARLLIKMLQGTKYENIKLLGGIVVLLKKDSTFVEYRVPKDIIENIFALDIKNYS